MLTRARIAIAMPLVAYLRASPLSRGKGFLTRHALRPLLPPPPASIELVRPGGTRIGLGYREVIGMSALTYGGFEDDECRLMLSLAHQGSWVIDVGANIGIHTIPIAKQIAPGRVIAVEPLPSNVERLKQNMRRNQVENVEIMVIAAGADIGVVELHLADDMAYASTELVVDKHATGQTLRVEQTTLDRLWGAAGEPHISVVKLDVEGSELAVIQGASRILDTERPSIVAEAQDLHALRGLEEALSRHRYRRRPVERLRTWNHLFQPDEADASGR